MARPHLDNCGLIGSVDVTDRIDPLYDNLVVWFPFTDKSGLNDVGPQRIQVDTAGVGDATVEALAGGSRSSLRIVTAPTGNPLGSCLQCDGEAYISLANSYLHNGGWQDGGDFTVECWVRATNQTHTHRGITGSTDFYWMAVQEHENVAGRWKWWGDSENQSSWTGDHDFINDGTNGKPGLTQLNQWHHICVTRTGDTVQSYIDGNFCRSLVYSTNLVNSTLQGNWDWFVGASQIAGFGSRPSPVTATSGPRTWIGQLSQFRLYNCAKYGGINFTPQWDEYLSYPNPISGVLTL